MFLLLLLGTNTTQALLGIFLLTTTMMLQMQAPKSAQETCYHQRYIDIACHSTNRAIIAHHSLICIPHMFSLIDKNLYDSFVHFDNGVYV